MRVLLTNPENDEVTYYLMAWTERILKTCKQKTNKYFHLKRNKVNRGRFEGILNKKGIDLVLLCGHGEDDRVYGERETILDSGNVNVLADKVVHALSCSSVKVLGELAAKSGARAYIGYAEDFIVFTDDRYMSKPLKDPTAALFLDAAFSVPKALLDGKSAVESVEIARKSYDKSIEKALSSDVQSDNDQFINWLYWDRDNLKLCER